MHVACEAFSFDLHNFSAAHRAQNLRLAPVERLNSILPFFTSGICWRSPGLHPYPCPPSLSVSQLPEGTHSHTPSSSFPWSGYCRGCPDTLWYWRTHFPSCWECWQLANLRSQPSPGISLELLGRCAVWTRSPTPMAAPCQPPRGSVGAYKSASHPCSPTAPSCGLLFCTGVDLRALLETSCIWIPPESLLLGPQPGRTNDTQVSISTESPLTRPRAT